MATIPQRCLFSWDQLDSADDLERLHYVLDGLCDEPLMRHLEKRRGPRGRDDYPVRAMWNSLIAAVVFQHPSPESLRRELSRNPALRQLCGFRMLANKQSSVPPPWVYTRFLKTLMDCQDQIDEMFNAQVSEITELLPDFGVHLACDGKAIASHANKRKEDDPAKPDGRRDLDADTGVKSYRGTHKDGSPWEKVTTWFGYQLNLIVDTKYELPVARTLTKASRSEVAEMKEELLPQLAESHPKILERCQAMMLDRGYDDTALTTTLRDEHDIAPIIGIRNLWKSGKTTKAVPGTAAPATEDRPAGPDVVHYDYQGHVTCWSCKDGKHQPMAYGGYEKDRQAHKYRCPARHYGISCASLESPRGCPIGSGSGQVRVPLSIDPRVFTPVARMSHKWKKLYNKRSASERVNSRIDQVMGFEHHFIRGKKKMTLRVSLALIVMLAMARGRIIHDEAAEMRSLLRPAA